MSTGVDYRYLLVDGTTGSALCEIPIYNARFTRVMTGVGEFTGQIPIDHPNATRANLGTLSTGTKNREVTVLRNGLPIWNGPITNINPQVTGEPPYYCDVTAREASWYLFKRVDNNGRAFSAADYLDAVRTLVTYATGKTYGALYNWAVTSGTSGHTITWAYAGSELNIIGEVIQNWANDPSTGFDYRMDYSTGSSFQQAHRTLTLGAPSLGGTLTSVLTRHMLASYAEPADMERSCNVLYTLGGDGHVDTETNTGSLTGGDLLFEGVYHRPEIRHHATLTSLAKEVRRLRQPPLRHYTVTYIPDGPPSPLALAPALPYGWCNLGDKITLNIDWPDLLAINDARRVTTIETVPPSQGQPELVTLTFDLPLEDLGS